MLVQKILVSPIPISVIAISWLHIILKYKFKFPKIVPLLLYIILLVIRKMLSQVEYNFHESHALQEKLEHCQITTSF